MKRKILISKSLFYLILLSLFFNSCDKSKNKVKVPKVEIKYKNGHAQLYRNGLPYHIKGASGTEHLEKVSLYGGNSIRTWSLHNAKELLDEAQTYGLTVTLGLEIGRPYWGEDFNYWNLIEVDKKIEELRPSIEEFKEHPALLMWGVGNEVTLKGGNRYLIYYIINRIAKMVKEEDPDHPVMTAINIQTIGRIKYLMTHIDVLGYNGFGLIEDFYKKDKNYTEKGWGKAYLLTEWGPPGHWEVNDTEWGAPLELSANEKLSYLKKNWELMNQDSNAFLGSYAFYWGNKFEITPTWFSHFSEKGLEAGSVNFLKSSWSGETFNNPAPNLTQMVIGNKISEVNTYLRADSIYSAKTFVARKENENLKYKWEIRPEESKFYKIDDYQHNMDYLMIKDDSESITFKAPKNEGPYRIFVYVSDDKGNFTSHNIPFYVVNGE
ncbi:glycoside hydrolase family 2 TIM barrel-domain containing protein [uncultured Cyclobacterium sp.]|uniref:glycoside hydrolase family 2 TIM barrel-domain containing protein n=1 Tax=uncultured Cyclobacterium sp. TaxID=453820 RepID=UPI0030EF864F